MEANLRRLKHKSDENAVQPSKQLSATSSTTQLDTQAPRRALQPLEQNAVGNMPSLPRSRASLPPVMNAGPAGPTSVMQNGESVMGMTSMPALTAAVTQSMPAINTVPAMTAMAAMPNAMTGMSAAIAAMPNTEPDAMRAESGSNCGSLNSDATIDDVNLDANISAYSEFDDAQLLAHDHSHTAAFSDDENDVLDETQLKIAVLGQPISACNPNALFPIETLDSRMTLMKCAEIVANTPGVLDSEDEDMWDSSMVLEYSEDIFRHLRVMELRLLPNKGYMEIQKELTWPLRAVLIDWLVTSHHGLNLLPETLFLCVNYIDRFLSLKEISLSRFQLVGAVALFLAAKFEEINYLSVQDVSHMVENNYPPEEIIRAERFMIDILDFNLGYPGPMSFLRRVSKADDYDLECRSLAKYLLEITIMDERFVGTPASWSAAVSHYMARFMLRQGPWTPKHIYFSNYTEEQLYPGVLAIREDIQDPKTHHKAIFEKYSERRFRRASVFVQNWVQFAHKHPEIDFVSVPSGPFV